MRLDRQACMGGKEEEIMVELETTARDPNILTEEVTAHLVELQGKRRQNVMIKTSNLPIKRKASRVDLGESQNIRVACGNIMHTLIIKKIFFIKQKMKLLRSKYGKEQG